MLATAGHTSEPEVRSRPRGADATAPAPGAGAFRLAVSRSAAPSVQRSCACGGGSACTCDEDSLRVQRRPGPGAPPAGARAGYFGAAGGEAHAAGVHEVLRSPGAPLDRGTRAFMEARFGRDFGGVRVHHDARAAESARALGALAYTVGQHVVFGSGRYAPHAPGGRWLLAHELVHTVQQGSAPVDGPLPLESPRSGAEAEASSLADALAGPGAPRVASPRIAAGHAAAIRRRAEGACVQRAVGTLCQPPGFWMGTPQAAAFGFIAEKLIEADYTGKMGVAPPVTAYFDSSLAGPVDPALRDFIDAHNALDAWKYYFLTFTPVQRPDMLADDGALREYDEIKPDSIFGVTRGFEKLVEIRAWMGALGLPYVRGSAYSPTARIPFYSATLPGGIPFELSLSVRRLSPGLVVYRLCVTTDFLKLGAALAAAIIAAIIYLLRGRIPVPGRPQPGLPQPGFASGGGAAEAGAAGGAGGGIAGTPPVAPRGEEAFEGSGAPAGGGTAGGAAAAALAG